MEQATFGAGCFWGVEATFSELPGVKSTAVGYMGGHVGNPSYEQVCTDTTGHAEVVHLEFDPQEISYEQLLQVFWKVHNPTSLNFQGPDVGSQYRSVIFYHTPEQQQQAEASKQALEASKTWSQPVVTDIVAAKPFYRAEEYHQQYLAKRGLANCHL